jgi:hypothetical protein
MSPSRARGFDPRAWSSAPPSRVARWRSSGSTVRVWARRRPSSRGRSTTTRPGAGSSRTTAVARPCSLALPDGVRGDPGRRLTTAGPVLGCCAGSRPAVRTCTSGRCCAAWSRRRCVREATSRFFAYGRAVETMRAAAVPAPLVPRGHRRRSRPAPPRRRQRADRAGTRRVRPRRHPLALLTNAERNLPFYEHHGFEVVDEAARRRAGRTPG